MVTDCDDAGALLGKDGIVFIAGSGVENPLPDIFNLLLQVPADGRIIYA